MRRGDGGARDALLAHDDDILPVRDSARTPLDDGGRNVGGDGVHLGDGVLLPALSDVPPVASYRLRHVVYRGNEWERWRTQLYLERTGSQLSFPHSS